MDFTRKTGIIIYISVLINAKLLHCIDVNRNVTMAPVVNENTNNNNNTSSSTTESDSSNQTTKLDSTIQPQEYGDAIKICNGTFPTPKGTEYTICEKMNRVVRNDRVKKNYNILVQICQL